MLWTTLEKSYRPEPFELESDLEAAIQIVKRPLFGEQRIYLEVKKLIGKKGSVQNIPDGYLLDLTSTKKPRLWLVENELAKHDPLKHIAVQVLQMSLSYESTPQKLKGIVKDALEKNPEGWKLCEAYVESNGFQNVDFLLEQMIYHGEFGALVVIDELHDELEKLLVSKFRFGVEVLTLNRFVDDGGERIYQFEPFQADVVPTSGSSQDLSGKTVDSSDLDTVVVPAQEDGFQETALKEDRWYQIRLSASMIPKIEHLAFYRVAPVSAITHVAPVKDIKPWQDSGKYVVNFSGPLEELEKPIKLVPKGNVKAPQSLRYTSYERLMNAKTLEEAF